ncbi:uncharacterized protein B0J16DRAFT_394133 [Fusarium flagelliforme]|uniref:uncharacterized protein n=1 Tax=Fusarium flagelliforme TaxID=2675880 RepID=UPI001E8E318C|nr:uncharacterized protein B0J16DRAFT_394133 [Fusarium flagelliforme]KAH7192028.1 hypothetical protein B0J16DRAFT_394133 [Fusarium flagelliforme]
MIPLTGAVCLICATCLPTVDPEEGLDPTAWTLFDWREDHLLLWGPTWPDHVKAPLSMRNSDEIDEIDETVIVYEAHVSGPVFATISTSRSVVMQTEYVSGESLRARRSRVYLPVHAACYAMARKVGAAPGSGITSLGDLWITLERRCREAISYGRTGGFYIPSIPNNRPGEPIELNLGRYYIPPQAICPRFSSLAKYGREWWTRDPLKIPDLTESLMSTLERAETPLADEGFSNRFDSLPPEIGNIVIENLIACVPAEGASSLECTYLIPQYRWKQALIQIPFLWDLENEIVERKDQEASTGLFEWNWEKLARLILSEFPIFRKGEACGYKLYSQSGHDILGQPIVPPAFANRRRIWQILMDMYPNDVGMFNRMG